MEEWGLVVAGEVGVRVSVAPVLASQSVAVEASSRHHVTLGVPAVCKAASPRNKGTCVSSLCHFAAAGSESPGFFQRRKFTTTGCLLGSTVSCISCQGLLWEHFQNTQPES